MAACNDGRTLLFDRQSEKEGGIWRLDADGSRLLRLTKGEYDHSPQCSADSKSVVFDSGNPSEWISTRVSIDGGAATAMPDPRSGVVSPDGSAIARFQRVERNGSQLEGMSISDLEGHAQHWVPLYGAVVYDWAPDG